MEQIILIIHVLIAIAIVALILLQQGKGADMGASFGSGSSQTLFGSAGSGNFLTKSTALLATCFFVTSFGLAIIAKDKASLETRVGLPSLEAIEQQEATQAEQEIPAAEEADAIPVPQADAGEEIPSDE
ncbi:MAG: preprotein translocase subunit SecG [Pseudomonadales bacterium]